VNEVVHRGRASLGVLPEAGFEGQRALYSLGKRSRVGGRRDGAELAFRVEFYNAMNHSQFANPGSTFRTASFGVITQTAVAPRLIQFGVKYLF
jgi:hypothetical protein